MNISSNRLQVSVVYLTIGSCFSVHYRVMEHLGSLESTQEARVALGYRLGQLLRFFRALQTSRVLHNSPNFPSAP